MTTTEERERRRLATYLHDNIGQVLALLQIKLGSLRRDLTSKKMAADLDEGRNLLTQIISATRSLTMEMGLSVLHELGFVAGLEWAGGKIPGPEQLLRRGELRPPARLSEPGQGDLSVPGRPGTPDQRHQACRGQ